MNKTGGNQRVMAYLNILVFDKNLTFVDGAFVSVSTQAKENGSDVPHQKLSKEIIVNQPGYVYIYLSNDNEEPVEVYFDDFEVEHAHSAILQTDAYYPFGLTFNSYRRENSVNNAYLYNGKELQEELRIDWYDYGARMYDPAIGRWHSVDPLSDLAESWTPYHYVKNNPLNRIDPNGLTDFKLNRETGEINRVGDPNDDLDRILKTDKDGGVKKKGEGFLGFLVKKSERGKAKVAVDGISKGILKDGLNLKENNSSFKVNGEGQPSLANFNKFISEFSDYVGKEIAGVRLGKKNSDNVSRVLTYKYKNSTKTKAETPLSWFSQFGGYLKGHFHTHPYNDHTPSDNFDIQLRNQYPNLQFFIIANGYEEEF